MHIYQFSSEQISEADHSVLNFLSKRNIEIYPQWKHPRPSEVKDKGYIDKPEAKSEEI